MSPNFLEYERPIADLEAKIQELRSVDNANALNLDEEIQRLEVKLASKIEQVFANLSSWQIAQMSRHPDRPYTNDYIRLVCERFHELHGDRAFADDPAIVGGLAQWGDRSVMLIGQQKGRGTKEKIHRNFGMPRPEGYRKALRLMQLAARFGLPIVTLIDTPGAYPGIGAEERGQSEAIARNLREMAMLPVPIVATVIGEGGSGGALAIGVADRVNILQYSIYSVISPEGCASILWKKAEHAETAAEALCITSSQLKKLGLVDQVIAEPPGGAHRDMQSIANNLHDTVLEQLNHLEQLSTETMLEQRYERLTSMGQFESNLQ